MLLALFTRQAWGRSCLLTKTPLALEVVSSVTMSKVLQVLNITDHKTLCLQAVSAPRRPRSPPQIQAEILPTTWAHRVELRAAGLEPSNQRTQNSTCKLFGPNTCPLYAAQAWWRGHPPQRSTHDATLQCPGVKMVCFSLACTTIQPALVSVKRDQP